MAVHSKIYLTAKRNYGKGLWSKEKLRMLVEVGALRPDEYEQITGETYESPDNDHA